MPKSQWENIICPFSEIAIWAYPPFSDTPKDHLSCAYIYIYIISDSYSIQFHNTSSLLIMFHVLSHTSHYTHMLSHPNIISYCEWYIPHIDILYICIQCLPLESSTDIQISYIHYKYIHIHIHTCVYIYIYVSFSFHSTAEGAFTRWLAGIDVPNIYIYI